MNEPQRYSGPEIGPLLRKVRDELGDDAAIVEANKVRSGGVAGFFTNEHYEVVADRRDDESGDPRPGPTGAPAPRVPSASQPRNRRSDDQPPGASIQSALLERAEHVSTREFLDRVAETDSISLGGDDFDTVLNHFLGDEAGTDSAPPSPRQRRRSDAARQPPPTHRSDVGHHPSPVEIGHSVPPAEPAPEPVVESPAASPMRRPPIAPAPDEPQREAVEEARNHERRPGPGRSGDGPAGAASDPGRAQRQGPDRAPESGMPPPAPVGRRNLLWRYLLSARGWRCPSVADARIAWFIGPYTAAGSVERRFGSGEPHDVMHLTPEADLGPRWATTNSFDEALERCRRWRQLDVAGSIVVDYPADEFDLQLLGELGPGHCDAVHLVTDNLDKMESLLDLCHFGHVPVMVDLTEAPPSGEIGAALDAGLPIASILGMEMTPQLIVAIRIDAAHSPVGAGSARARDG